MGILSVGVHDTQHLEESRSPSLSPEQSHSNSPALASSKRLHEIHIPSPDHAASVASSEHFQKSGLVAAQEAALHDSAVLEMGYQMTESEYAFMPEGVILKAPSIGTEKDLKALKPIRLKNLKVGKVHRGRILSGTLCCKSVKTSAVMNVLEEDSTGDTTRVLVANAVPRSATTAQAQRLYPEGAQLSVREPYLKRFSDGIIGLLVENPADIIFNYLPVESAWLEYEKEEFTPKPLVNGNNRWASLQSDGQETHIGGVGVISSGGSFASSNSVSADEEQSSFLADARADGLLDNQTLESALSSEEGAMDNHSEASTWDEPSTRNQPFPTLGTEDEVHENIPVGRDEPKGLSLEEREIAGEEVSMTPEFVPEDDLESNNDGSSEGQDAIVAAELENMSMVQVEREGDRSTEDDRAVDDGCEGSIECIKSVVEESLEISSVTQLESGKGMPETVRENPKANGETETDRQSPSPETSVEKEIISGDSKNSGGVNDRASEDFLTAVDLRLQGNKHFARQDWAGAIELYSQAIIKAVQEFKENSSPNRVNKFNDQPSNDEPESEVVMDYSNRAEAWLRLHHYERAWADSERALSLDPNHLKSLFRKGRALLGVGDYQQALAHLEAAYARAPYDKDLLAAIQLSRIGDHQSRLGIFDLTDYYLRGRFAGEVPTCADFVGPVQVRIATGEKGRGLFLTKGVEAGDLLLVSNPLAMLESKSGSKGRKNGLDLSVKGNLRFDAEVEQKLVHSVRERAKVSSKNRQRLLALCHGEGSMSVPSMDLFVPGRRIAPMDTPELDEPRIRRIIARNAIDRNMVSTTLEKRHLFHREVSEDNSDDRCFYGLWVLPSFINHSCHPNVSIVVMGRALFVYASRDLGPGEELLCSYANVFQPLPQRREIASKCWGFTCRCARCLLETRFETSLKRLYSLHTRLEPNPTFVLQFSPFGYKAPAKDLAKELEIIEMSKKLDNRSRSWLQASFTQLYTVSRDFMGPHGNHPYLEAALRAMELVCPGSNSTLEVGLLARETVRKEFNGRNTPQYKAVNQQVLRICQCIYGKQKTAVLQSLADGTPPDVTRKS